jgi:uncharacterized membrane-anchored protein YitT (DUF2179 family)
MIKTAQASRRRRNLSPWLVTLKEYLLLFAGAFLVAIAFNLFLNAFDIASGGVSGISIIVEDLLGIRPAFSQWAMNITLIVIGFLLVGKQFGLKTIIGTLILPFFVMMTEGWPTFTTEPLLAALYGGVGVGAGLGLVFLGNASTGGTDLIAQILHKFTGLSLGIAVLIIDGLVVLSAGIVYGPELALYALIALFVTGRTIDIVQTGLRVNKLAIIISNQQEVIQRAILHELDRGLTRLPAYGGYTDEERPVLICVVYQNEITALKKLVSKRDPHAFVIVTDAKEVLGEGFKVE